MSTILDVGSFLFLLNFEGCVVYPIVLSREMPIWSCSSLLILGVRIVCSLERNNEGFPRRAQEIDRDNE